MSETVITVEVSQRSLEDKPWFWIMGDTYPHRDLLRNEGARWSKKRKAWYMIAWELPEAIQQLVDKPPQIQEAVLQDDDAPCSDEEAEQILGVKLLPKVTEAIVEPESEMQDVQDEEAQLIRIIKPQVMSDESNVVQMAIQQIKAVPLQVSAHTNYTAQTRWQIPQEACGELTGSITGQVWSYGYAVYEGTCVFLNMGGPRMAVEAIRAKLSKGDVRRTTA
jgi:hypothetical protein